MGDDPAGAAGGSFFAPTQYAGAFLLLPIALNWLSTAKECFRDEYGSLCRGLLTSLFALVVGLQGVFHLDQMEDLGFALLTGGRKCPSRHLVRAWRRHLTWYEVDRFCQRTAAWDWIAGRDAVVRLEEHSLPRWTHKFLIPKGFVTTRNKYMPCEKLYYGYGVVHDRYLSVRGTPGRVELRDVALRMTREVLTRAAPCHLHALLDAGAGKSDADVPALFELAEDTPALDARLLYAPQPGIVATAAAVLLSACRFWISASTSVQAGASGVPRCPGAACNDCRDCFCCASRGQAESSSERSATS